MKDSKKVAAGKKGGYIKWSRISKKKRSQIMRKVALARYSKEVVDKSLVLSSPMLHT